jgi:hypothetical protein
MGWLQITKAGCICTWLEKGSADSLEVVPYRQGIEVGFLTGRAVVVVTETVLSFASTEARFISKDCYIARCRLLCQKWHKAWL